MTLRPAKAAVSSLDKQLSLFLKRALSADKAAVAYDTLDMLFDELRADVWRWSGSARVRAEPTER